MNWTQTRTIVRTSPAAIGRTKSRPHLPPCPARLHCERPSNCKIHAAIPVQSQPPQQSKLHKHSPISISQTFHSSRTRPTSDQKPLYTRNQTTRTSEPPDRITSPCAPKPHERLVIADPHTDTCTPTSNHTTGQANKVNHSICAAQPSLDTCASASVHKYSTTIHAHRKHKTMRFFIRPDAGRIMFCAR